MHDYQKNVGELIWKITSPGIKDWARENRALVELLDLTKIKLMTREEQKDQKDDAVSVWQ